MLVSRETLKIVIFVNKQEKNTITFLEYNPYFRATCSDRGEYKG